MHVYISNKKEIKMKSENLIFFESKIKNEILEFTISFVIQSYLKPSIFLLPGKLVYGSENEINQTELNLFTI